MVAPAELGAGERLMDRALLVLYQLRGQLPATSAPGHPQGNKR
jgi:hypothetical protein